MKCLRNVKLYSFRFFLPPSNQIGDRFTPEEDRRSNEGRQHKDHRVSGIISAIFDWTKPLQCDSGWGEVESKLRHCHTKKNRWGSLAGVVSKLLIYSLSYRGKYFTVLLLLFLHTKTKGRGRRENNNKLLPKFPPKLCQLLYIFIVNWMPPPSSSIDEICVFCHRTIWQKKQKAITAVLWNAIFTANSVFAELSLDLPRNNARILRSGVNRRNIDLWPKTELVVDVNYQLAVNHREGDKEPQTQQDCRKPGLIEK